MDSNFGIFKHPGTGGSNSALLPPPSTVDDSNSSLDPESIVGRSRRSSSVARNDLSTAQEQLKAKGFLPIQWYGKCDADKVSMGTYAVAAGQGGNFGLIFDNTFSKTVSKTATFVLLTYPSNAPPHATYHEGKGQGSMSMSSVGKTKSHSPRLGASASASVDSFQSHLVLGNGSRGNSIVGKNESDLHLATYHVGILSKRRRKRGQGYARRFFSLDFASCTLSYYYNRNSSALRGAIPLSLAAIAADERRREISIDSGAEVWHLKAGNARDFDDWTRALQKASNTARGVDPTTPAPKSPMRIKTSNLEVPNSSHDEEQEWQQVEALVSRIVGTRDAVRRLSKDSAPGELPTKKSYPGLGISAIASPKNEEGGDYFAAPAEKRPFWKRKASAPSSPQVLGRAIASQLAVPSPSAVPSVTASASGPSSRRPRHVRETSVHDHYSSLLRDLDSVLNDFSNLIASSKRRRIIAPMSAGRRSFDTVSTTDEFYDATEGNDDSQVMIIDRRSDEETQPSEADDEMITDSSSISSDEDEPNTHVKGAAKLFPNIPKTLDPLPLSSIPNRRRVVPPAAMLPPSLIGFLRKNVGKDLSTISMPVSSNEPISLLQRVAEQLEYASLLDIASANNNPAHRLLYVTAFAVSQFSNNRARERAIRKPFNPMLGETFELVRSDQEVPGGFRMIVEKVTHRPVVRMACQADAQNWSFSQSPAPTQKFWGKSAELTTDGRVRMTLRLSDGTEELFSWNVATAFLRNVVMGEKYVEPVGTMTINNETTGTKAVVEFKTKGMFSGRSEDVQVETFTAEGKSAGSGLTGTWTNALRITEGGKAGQEIWRIGDLVDGAPKCYGLTTFAASLNEITDIEQGKLPSTDTRLRPDQRAAENGKLDEAEQLKATLEENQRVRRKAVEQAGKEHVPRWFVKVDDIGEGEEVWKLKSGKDGYWDVRSRGDWSAAGVEDVLAV